MRLLILHLLVGRRLALVPLLFEHGPKRRTLCLPLGHLRVFGFLDLLLDLSPLLHELDLLLGYNPLSLRIKLLPLLLEHFLTVGFVFGDALRIELPAAAFGTLHQLEFGVFSDLELLLAFELGDGLLLGGLVGDWWLLGGPGPPREIWRGGHIRSFHGLVGRLFGIYGSVHGFWVVRQHRFGGGGRLPAHVAVRPHPRPRFFRGWLVLLGLEQLQGAAGLVDLLLAVIGGGHRTQGHISGQSEDVAFRIGS